MSTETRRSCQGTTLDTSACVNGMAKMHAPSRIVVAENSRRGVKGVSAPSLHLPRVLNYGYRQVSVTGDPERCSMVPATRVLMT